MNHEERAKSLLRHYFRMMALAAGVRWDSDNDAEVVDIIDHIIAVAVAAAIGAIQDLPEQNRSELSQSFRRPKQ